MTYTSVAVIPARGGSKRIPRKNIKNFLGKPMLERTIHTLKSASIFDEIIVSTDDNEIAEIARLAGAKVPFLRDAKLADDHTPTAPVIAETLKKYFADYKVKFDLCCCVYPCNPILNVEIIKKAKFCLEETGENFVYPVCKYPHPVQRSMKMMDNGKMLFKYPEYELTRTQDFEELFHDAGQFYFGKSSAWLSGKKMHTDGIGMAIPSNQVIDIDTLEDWERAELLYKIIENDKLE